MTAYLQPGDKIIIQIPHSADDAAAKTVMNQFTGQGIAVISYFTVGPTADVNVVAVIRSPDLYQQ